MKLKIDPARIGEFQSANTGYLVRAQDKNGKWVNVDIIHLDAVSLLNWLRSRGGYNPWAESLIFNMLESQMPEVALTPLQQLQAGISVAIMWDLEISSDEDSVIYITTKKQIDPLPQEAASALEKIGGWTYTNEERIHAYRMYLP